MLTKEFYNFIKERESIRLKKAQGLPRPWTKDPVLQNYKFTNVRREHDKTTQKLIEMFYSKQGQSSSQEIILLNCALFRYFGTWELAEAIGWQKAFDPNLIIKIASQRLRRGERVFTGAYMITNVGITGPKEEIVVNRFITELWQHRAEIIKEVNATNNWQKVAAKFQPILGFGGSGFMAKETLLDTMHCNFWPGGKPSDYWEWTPIGPGGRRGINRVMGYEVNRRLPDETMLKIIRDLTDLQDTYWPSEWGKLSPTDIQFQLCELSKYYKVVNGEGRPRSKYAGTGEEKL